MAKDRGREGKPSTRRVMQFKRLICIATLVLMIASFVVVAIDGLVLPNVKHESDNCPICAFAQSLTTVQLPPPVPWMEPTDVHWLPPERLCILCSDLSLQSFSARAPPSWSI
jgi:hypothetical protein